SWNITGKISEVDQYLKDHPHRKHVIHEAHPELCFKYLNHGKLLNHRKREKNNLGIYERLDILERFFPGVYHRFAKAKNKRLLKWAQPDDLVDAMCLGVTARLGFEFGFEKLVGSSSADENNIEMCMYYFDPSKHQIS
ncbi:MAG: DUF429 domain-containing protein, partial [Cytophagales bacterium]|nr:DUF429 domain-containing protein [Cytophagales bacterium]